MILSSAATTSKSPLSNDSEMDNATAYAYRYSLRSMLHRCLRKDVNQRLESIVDAQNIIEQA